MKVGDLVRHEPKGFAESELNKVFEDWGWMPDFSCGVILEVRDESAQVHYIDNNVSPPQPGNGWYRLVELRFISEGR